MDELLEILREIKPDIDFEHEDNLIESGLMDSLDIVAIIDAVQEHFKIELIAYLDYYNNRRVKLKLNGLPPAIHRRQALSIA